MQQKSHGVATSGQVRQILGPVDEDIVVNVIRTGATSEEIAEAFEWLNDDDYMGADLNKSMNDHVRQVYELLQNERDRVGQED